VRAARLLLLLLLLLPSAALLRFCCTAAAAAVAVPPVLQTAQHTDQRIDTPPALLPPRRAVWDRLRMQWGWVGSGRWTRE
jgi:hypothetical protein